MRRCTSGYEAGALPPDRGFIDESLASLEDNLVFLRTLAQRPLDDFLRSKEATYSAAYRLCRPFLPLSPIKKSRLAPAARRLKNEVYVWLGCPSQTEDQAQHEDDQEDLQQQMSGAGGRAGHSAEA